MEAKLKELVEADIIEEVKGTTPWVSPVCVVPKPSGSVLIWGVQTKLTPRKASDPNSWWGSSEYESKHCLQQAGSKVGIPPDRKIRGK